MPWCQTKHIIEFTKDLHTGQEEFLEDGITISDDSKLQHYMEQMYGCRVFNMEQMNHYEDYSEIDRTVLETTTYFGELVESIDKQKENSESKVQQIFKREKELTPCWKISQGESREPKMKMTN